MQNLASSFPKHARHSASCDLSLIDCHVSVHGEAEQLHRRLEAVVSPAFMTALSALQKECGDGLIAARKLLAALDRLCKIADGVVAVRGAAEQVPEPDSVVVDTDFIKCLGRLRSSIPVLNSMGFALQEESCDTETKVQRFTAVDEPDSDGTRTTIQVVTAVRDLLELDRSAVGQQFAISLHTRVRCQDRGSSNMNLFCCECWRNAARTVQKASSLNTHALNGTS